MLDLMKRLVVGRPLRSDRLTEQSLPKRVALPVFASDPLSSVAYAPEEIFLVRITAAAARSFVERSLSVIGAGRPDCPFCGEPVDPDGHLCVRANGFRRRDP